VLTCTHSLLSTAGQTSKLSPGQTCSQQLEQGLGILHCSTRKRAECGQPKMGRPPARTAWSLLGCPELASAFRTVVRIPRKLSGLIRKSRCQTQAGETASGVQLITQQCANTCYVALVLLCSVSFRIIYSRISKGQSAAVAAAECKSLVIRGSVLHLRASVVGFDIAAASIGTPFSCTT
jgi:hypothetical protein